LFQEHGLLGEFVDDLGLFFLVLFVDGLELLDDGEVLGGELLLELVVEQKELVDVVLDDLHHAVPQAPEPFYVDHEFASGEAVVLVFDEDLQELHEHWDRVDDVVDFLVLVETVVHFDEERNLEDLDLLHEAVVGLLGIGLVQLRVRGDKVYTAGELINGAPAPHPMRNLFLREHLPDILDLAHPMEVHIAQPIDHHLQLFSIQIVDDLLHHLVLGHQDEDVVQGNAWFLEVGGG